MLFCKELTRSSALSLALLTVLLVHFYAQDFRTCLSKGLSSINRRWRDVFPDSDQRLRPLVEGLSQRCGTGEMLQIVIMFLMLNTHQSHRYLGPDLSATGTLSRRSDLTPGNLPAVSARHFPLCMHGLMQALRREHHLRHNGRQQLSLFLKVWGLISVSCHYV